MVAEQERVEVRVGRVNVSVVSGLAFGPGGQRLDVLVDIERSRLLHAALRDRDWPCTLTELDGADHAGVVMTVYDPEARRCQPTDADHVLRAGNQTAQVIARAATSPSGP